MSPEQAIGQPTSTAAATLRARRDPLRDADRPRLPLDPSAAGDPGQAHERVPGPTVSAAAGPADLTPSSRRSRSAAWKKIRPTVFENAEALAVACARALPARTPTTRRRCRWQPEPSVGNGRPDSSGCPARRRCASAPHGSHRSCPWHSTMRAPVATAKAPPPDLPGPVVVATSRFRRRPVAPQPFP